MNDPDTSNSSGESKRGLRTCTATLKQILWTDILLVYDNLVSIMRQRQLAITNILNEVSVVVQKATPLRLFEPASDTVDIRNALPSGFIFRAKINPLVRVAELPELLQGALERGLQENISEPLGDLV
ncbi:hypothetical protein BGZ68_002628 [Mortierella alpina]|nr:hypothetical protein BGZ68_002628 [Mortierella alpina]